MGRIIFITGTDTGVGKTVLSGLLLYHLRRSGVRALAMKPFCSGDRGDVDVLQSLQPGELSDEEMNPWFFKLPLAPLAAARLEGRRIGLGEVLAKITWASFKCDVLLVEGAGGLLSPLAEGVTLAKVIAELGGDVVVVAPNKLGVINQVCLTVTALPKTRKNWGKVVLMSQEKPDISAKTNPVLLEELLWGTNRGRKMKKSSWEMKKKIFAVPFLDCNPLEISNLQKYHKKLKKVLQALAGKLT